MYSAIRVVLPPRSVCFFLCFLFSSHHILLVFYVALLSDSFNPLRGSCIAGPSSQPRGGSMSTSLSPPRGCLPWSCLWRVSLNNSPTPADTCRRYNHIFFLSSKNETTTGSGVASTLIQAGSRDIDVYHQATNTEGGFRMSIILFFISSL